MRQHTATFVDPYDQPISAASWGYLVEELGLDHIIAQTHLETRVGDIYVRTTWTGCVVPGRRQPFGITTAANEDGPWTEVEQYPTRAAALAGHASWSGESPA